jgi:hypothetical protein
MPTPAQIKATKKSIKAWIKELNKKTEGNLAYNNIKEDIAQIYKIENEAERYQMIREYELIVRNQISDHFFDRRTVIHSSRSLIDKYSKQQITSTPPSAIVDGVRRIVNLFCSLHEEDFAKKHPMTREKADEELNWTLDEISKRNYYDEMPKFFKEWDTACVRQEIENFKEAYEQSVFRKKPNYKYEGKIGKTGEGFDTIAASAYYLAQLMKADLETEEHKTRWWRFMNFRKVGAYKEYIKTVEDMFKRIDFDPATHGEAALEGLKHAIMQPHDRDIDTAKNEHRIAHKWVKEQETPQLNIARGQLGRAKELDKKLATSFYAKMKDLMDKYNISKDRFKELSERFSLENAAEKYDKERDIDAVKSCAATTYMRLLADMLENTLVVRNDLDIKDVLKDAGTLCEAIMENYLDFSKMKELQSLDKPVYAYGVELEGIQIRINSVARGITYEDPEKPGEYKKLVPPADVIERARNEAAEVVSTWEKKPQNEINNEGPKPEEIDVPKEEKENENLAHNDEKIERKPLTSEARALASEMLKIGFRPSKENLQAQLENAKLITQFFDKNEMISKESYAVFKASKSKLMHYKSAVENGKVDEMETQFQTTDKVLEAQYGNIKLQAIEDIEKERMNINLDAQIEDKNAQIGGEENQAQIQPKIENEEKESVNNISLMN